MKIPSQTFAASRFLCPVEMLLGLCSLAWGISGGLLEGQLWLVLSMRGENLPWMIVLSAVGGMQFMVAGVEWFFGRNWPTWRLCKYKLSVHRSVFVRYVLAFFSTAMWVYVVSTLGDSHGTRSIGALWLMAPTAILFSMWIFYENKKVYCAIDPGFNTSSTLSFRR